MYPGPWPPSFLSIFGPTVKVAGEHRPTSLNIPVHLQSTNLSRAVTACSANSSCTMFHKQSVGGVFTSGSGHIVLQYHGRPKFAVGHWLKTHAVYSFIGVSRRCLPYEPLSALLTLLYHSLSRHGSTSSAASTPSPSSSSLSSHSSSVFIIIDGGRAPRGYAPEHALAT